MNGKKVLSIVYKIIGVLQILFGLLSLFTIALLLFTGGLIGYAEMLAGPAGRYLGQAETIDGGTTIILLIIGAAFTFLLAVVQFGAGYALLASKKWAYLTLFALTVVGLISGGTGLISGNSDFMATAVAELVWSVIYAVLGILAYKSPDIFNK
jgi:hypothetical protein